MGWVGDQDGPSSPLANAWRPRPAPVPAASTLDPAIVTPAATRSAGSDRHGRRSTAPPPRPSTGAGRCCSDRSERPTTPLTRASDADDRAKAEHRDVPHGALLLIGQLRRGVPPVQETRYRRGRVRGRPRAAATQGSTGQDVDVRLGARVNVRGTPMAMRMNAAAPAVTPRQDERAHAERDQHGRDREASTDAASRAGSTPPSATSRTSPTTISDSV